MITLEDRHRTVQWLEGACRDGARLKLACEVAGIDARTVQRWKAGIGLQRGDRRPQAIGACQPSCRSFYAAAAAFNSECNAAFTTDSRSGLSVTVAVGVQLRV